METKNRSSSLVGDKEFRRFVLCLGSETKRKGRGFFLKKKKKINYNVTSLSPARDEE